MTVDELREYGLEEMSDEDIHNSLVNEGHGVLGLPTKDAPYLLPMSFGFNGQSTLYFSYFVGEESRKEDLAEQADVASFLVYSPDSVFYWKSVLLIGTLSKVPESEWDAHQDALDNAWHLDLFEKGTTAGHIKLYQFEIMEQSGLKCMGLPPGMEDNRPSDA